jgi:hypothetical protein
MGTTKAVIAMLWITLLLNAGEAIVRPEVVNGTAVPVTDIDGRVMVPVDLNGDGLITGDIEGGS